MDRKPQPPRYPMSKNITKNYISELKIDNDSIDTIYSEFVTGEYSDIMKIISSNQILNFRNVKGETLIHAILKNPSSSLTEQNILDIIQMLVHKNVSINAMNEYNQTPVHLAAKSGYYDVIDYLITMKADFNKIDNYGNAPIHYLIDNFIQDCKEDEYYKISNKKMKKTSGVEKYEQMTEKFIVLALVEELEVSANKDKITHLLRKIKQIVQYYKFYKVEDINKIVNSKNLEIDNLYKSPNTAEKKSLIQKILFSSVSEFNSIYKDLNFENKILDNNINDLINSETINEINKNITDDKLAIMESFKKELNKTINFTDEVQKKIEELKKTIFSLHKLMYVCFYINQTLKDLNLDNKTLKTSINLTSEILSNFYTRDQMVFFDFEKMIEQYNLIEKEQEFITSNQEELYQNTQFIRDDPRFRRPTPEVHKIHLTIDYVPASAIPTTQLLPHFNYTTILNTSEVINYYLIITKTKNYSGNKILNGTNCILVVLLNIITYLDKYLTIIKETDFNSVENYSLYYLNYFTEIIINTSNNLSVFNNLYSKLNVQNIVKLTNQLINVMPRENMYGLLLGQIAWFGESFVYDLRNGKDVDTLNEMINGDISVSLSNFEKLTTDSLINKYLNDIYMSFLKLQNDANNLVEFTNKYYVNKYMQSLISMIKLNPLDNSITLNNFFINKFYSNKRIFPPDLNSYKNKYFQENAFTLVSLEPIKKDLLKKYYDYDFNQLFDTTDYFTSSKGFYHNKITVKTIIHNGLNKYFFDTKPNYYRVRFAKNKYVTGYNRIFYKAVNPIILDTTIFSNNTPFSTLIESTDNNAKWLQVNTDEYNIYDQPIPIITFGSINQIFKLLGYKISELLDRANYKNIIDVTKNYLLNEGISEKKLNLLMNSLDYLLKPENEELLKKVVIEKIILFINSYIKIQVNEEINGLLVNIKNLMISNPLRKLEDDVIIQDVKNEYSTELKKYTMQNMIPELLKRMNVGTWTALTQALVSTDDTLLKKSNQRKLLLNKCATPNKIDMLGTKLRGKINLRILDRNGNTILNRLIDQYNYYGIIQVLKLDPELYTWENNRGQNSIEYLYTLLNSIDSKYGNKLMNTRILSYESDLQVWIKAQNFSEIELDESKHMIYNIIFNSLFLFNDCLWLLLLQAPNGWKFEDKIKLKNLIKKYKKYELKEKLLIKSLTDADKTYMKSIYSVGSLNSKILQIINDLKKEITDLTNTNSQLEQEKNTLEVVAKTEVNPMLDSMINKNNLAIKQKQGEINKLNSALIKESSQNLVIDKLFNKITDAKLIKSMCIDWDNYNKLIRDDLWNFYLPLIEIQNKKNNSPTEKYMSVYNYGLLNLPYKLLNLEEIKLLSDYNNLIINNIYADYYDLEKYEDIEFNYINDYILNIIYLNVVNVISIEMYNGIIEFLANKYSSNARIKEIIENIKNPDVIPMYDTMVELLKNAVWDKLKLKNPELEKNYQDVSFYIMELKSKIKIIFTLLENPEDNEFLDKIINFYKGICENVSYNVYQEIINLLNDLKRRSLLFEILNLIKKK